MSNLNERIDEILKEHILDTGSAMSNNIRKAMQQVAMEYYTKGEVSLQRVLMPKLLNLKDLVKVQKELIAIYEKGITLGDPDVWELYLKIKQLEK